MLTDGLKLGLNVRLKKKHPCGGNEFVIERLGGETMLKCLKCSARVELPRDRLIRSIRPLTAKPG